MRAVFGSVWATAVPFPRCLVEFDVGEFAYICLKRAGHLDHHFGCDRETYRSGLWERCPDYKDIW